VRAAMRGIRAPSVRRGQRTIPRAGRLDAPSIRSAARPCPLARQPPWRAGQSQVAATTKGLLIINRIAG
jgi:hypothetical protein